MEPRDFRISDEELNKALLEIDRELRQSSPQISGRELRGCLAFGKKFRVAMSSDDPLATRIFDWFTQQYGDSLNMD